MDIVAVPASVISALAIAGFGLALLAAVLTPVLARFGSLAAWAGPLKLVPYALLFVGAAFAVAAAVLGATTATWSGAPAGSGSLHAGVREVASAGLALVCITPLVGAGVVRARYGEPGRRTFTGQIAANQGSSILLVLVLFEIMAVTGFLIGAAVGVAFEAALALGLIVSVISILLTLAATWFTMSSGDGVLLDLEKAKEAGPAEQQLRNVVTEMATAAGIPMPRIYVIETQAANALSVGWSPDKAAVAVTRGLLDTLDREELQGVIAHELGHIANLDSRHAVLVAMLVGAVVVLTDVFFALIIEVAKNPWTGDDLSDTAAALGIWLVVVVVGLIVGGLLKLIAPFAALAVQAAVSRDREYLADATAVGMTRNIAGLVEALEKLEGTRASMAGANRGTQHLWIVNPVKAGGEGGRGWFDTHPATSDRVARLRAMAGVEVAGAPETAEATETAEA